MCLQLIACILFQSNLCGWETVSQVGPLVAELNWEVHNRHKGQAGGPLLDKSSRNGGMYSIVNLYFSSFYPPLLFRSAVTLQRHIYMYSINLY